MNRKIRRIFVILILLPMILLSSCAKLPTPGTDITPGASASNGTAEASPTDDISPSPAPTDWHSGVKTDYSGLTPYAPLEEKYTRLKDSPMPDLKPSANYGKLMPYVGKTMYARGGYYTVRLYGLMTEAGKLVTDPVFTGVFQGSYYNYATYSSENVPAFNVEKLSDKIDKDNPWNSELHAACAQDGSWITKFEYSGIFFTDKVILLIRDNDKNDVDIMDYSGKLLYNTKSLSCYDKIPASSAYAFQSGYGEGLIAVALSDGQTVFIDALTGDETYTEYEQANAFSNGYAAVMQNGLYGYVDKSLSLAITPQFQWAEFFNDGKSVVHYPDNSSAIIDTHGTILLENQYYISRWDSKTYGISDANNNYTYYDSNLKQIMPGAKGLTSLYNGWFYYIEDNGVTVFKGDEKYTFHGVTGVNNVSGNLATVYKNDGVKWQEGLMTLSGENIIPLTDNQSISSFTDEKSGKAYAIASTYDNNQTYKIYDAEGKMLFSGNGSAMYNGQYGLFEVNDELSFGYVDTTGKYVFRISLLQYVPD